MKNLNRTEPYVYRTRTEPELNFLNYSEPEQNQTLIIHGTVYLLNYTILAVCLFLSLLFSVLICLIL